MKHKLQLSSLLWKALLLTAMIALPVAASAETVFNSIKELKERGINGETVRVDAPLRVICNGYRGYLTDGQDFLFVHTDYTEWLNGWIGKCINGIRGKYDKAKCEVNGDGPYEECDADISIPQPEDISATVTALGASMEGKYVAARGKYDITTGKKSYIVTEKGKHELYNNSPEGYPAAKNMRLYVEGFVHDDEGKYIIDVMFMGKNLDSNVDISVAAVEGGTAWIDSRGAASGSFEPYSYHTLYAEPESGYVFVNWTSGGEVVSTLPEFALRAENGAVYAANFELSAVAEMFTVTVSAGTGGKAHYDGGQSVTAGTQVSVSAIAAEGYVFDGWYEGELKVSEEADYSFAVKKDTQLEARFVPAVEMFTIAVSASPGGSAVYDGGQSVAAGTQVSVSAVAAEEFVFDGWYDGELRVSSEATYSFAIEKDTDLQARFVKMPEETAPSSGCLSDFLGGSLEESGRIELTGAYLVVFTEGGNPIYVSDGTNVLRLEGRNPAFKVGEMISGIIFNAKTEKNGEKVGVLTEEPVKSELAPLTMQHSEICLYDLFGEGAARYTNKLLKVKDVYLKRGSGSDNTYLLQDEDHRTSAMKVFVEAGDDLLGDIKPWSESNQKKVFCSVTGMLYQYSEGNTIIACAVTRAGAEAETVSLKVVAGDGGSAWIGTDRNNTSGSFETGAGVEVHAEAGDGYDFSRWERDGECVSESTDWQTVMSESMELTAVFVRKSEPRPPVDPQPGARTIRILSSDPSKGSVSAEGFDGNEFEAEGEVVMTAVPLGADDYFVHWADASGAVVGTDATFRYSGEAPAVFTAVFSSRYKVEFASPSNGTLSVARVDGQAIASGDKVEAGTEIEVVFTPAAGYKIRALLVNGTPVHHTSEPYRTTVDKPLSIRGEVDAIVAGMWLITVVSSDAEMGTVYINNPGVTSLQVSNNENVEIHAEPAEDCVFTCWTNADGGWRSPNAVLTVSFSTGDCHYTGVFDYLIQTPRRVSVRSSNGAKGRAAIKGSAAVSVVTQRFVTVEAVALSANDRFVNWTDRNGVVVSSEPVYTYKGAAEAELTANFESCYEVRFSSSGQGELTVVTADGKPIASGDVLNDGTAIVVKTTPDNEHQELTRLRVNGVDASGNIDDNGELRVTLTGPLYIEAEFGPVHYNVTMNDPVHGSLRVYRAIDANGNGAGAALGLSDRAPYSALLHIFVTAEAGYRLKALKINGESKGEISRAAEADFTYLTHTVEGHVNIEAEFEAVTDAIDSIGADSEAIEAVYDLHGRYLGTELPRRSGIYILKRGGKTTKVRI
jgi:hypothetical protein